jgi:hypothetical protein
MKDIDFKSICYYGCNICVCLCTTLLGILLSYLFNFLFHKLVVSIVDVLFYFLSFLTGKYLFSVKNG